MQGEMFSDALLRFELMSVILSIDGMLGSISWTRLFALDINWSIWP